MRGRRTWPGSSTGTRATPSLRPRGRGSAPMCRCRPHSTPPRPQTPLWPDTRRPN
ncbi:hypothetical protein M885DRAFT_532739 [Pelagophyceae sp. CCMP2097]|nr:hypothetical protein M885DRAFT_532739 [Pelagophyceae sp. CCMP2097]